MQGDFRVLTNFFRISSEYSEYSKRVNFSEPDLLEIRFNNTWGPYTYTRASVHLGNSLRRRSSTAPPWRLEGRFVRSGQRVTHATADQSVKCCRRAAHWVTVLRTERFIGLSYMEGQREFRRSTENMSPLISTR